MSNPAATTALPTPIVSTMWLAQHIGAPHVKVVDASMYLPNANRNSRAEYDAAHIPGAVFADFTVLSDEHAPFPHTLLDAARFGERIGALGIGSDDAIVVYDTSGQNFSAPRLWWMLRTFGHRNVAVLDGGFVKWTAEGRAVTPDITVITPATFTATLDTHRVRDIGAMRANVDSHAEQVVDARSPGRFQATEPEPRAGVRGGHIPGSVNVHYATLVNADGTLRTPDELRAIVADAGLDLAKPIVASCGTGVTACAVVLALDVLGKSDTAVFDGSWTEWGSASDTPVVTGPA
jgi:thiosulfate/3-mercaptopyruvate sulfurtransferase